MWKIEILNYGVIKKVKYYQSEETFNRWLNRHRAHYMEVRGYKWKPLSRTHSGNDGIWEIVWR